MKKYEEVYVGDQKLAEKVDIETEQCGKDLFMADIVQHDPL